MTKHIFFLLCGMLFCGCGTPSTPVHPTVLNQFSIRNLQTALEEHQKETGHFPAESTWIESMHQYFPRSRQDGILDTWGRPFTYRVVDGKAKVISAGPDGQIDTTDDITDSTKTE